MPGIFISYRREDTAGHAGRIFDRLREKFGQDKVFMDVADIEPGVDFVEAIDRAVGSCDVLLVVIGKQWLSCTDAAGKRRLDDPKDFIRLETATALRRNIRVIPVLVQGAAMPSEGPLPDDLKALARRQGTEISDTQWDASIERLIKAVEKVIAAEPKPTPSKVVEPAPITPPVDPVRDIPGPVPHPGNGKRRIGIVAALIVLVLAVAGAFFLVPSKKVEVPRLIGNSLDEAVARLTQVHLKPGVMKHAASGQQSGSVIEQDPPPGSRIARESAVNLVIAERGALEPVPIEVPRLIGQPLERALRLLEGARLAAAEPVRKATQDAPAGTVLEQVPRAGTQVAPRTPVELVIAISPEEPALVKVPDLLGMNVKEAMGLLRKAGLQIEPKAERMEFTKAKPGTVVRQSAKPGSTIRPDENVVLVYAVAPTNQSAAEIGLPDFTKWPVAKVEQYLTEKGLVLGSVREKATSGDRPGTVLDQSPPATTRMKKGAAVNLTVAVSPELHVLAAPEQVWPNAGYVFDNNPRIIAVSWSAVLGAASYAVEVDCLNCCGTGRWCSESGRPWKIERNIGVVKSPGHKFKFGEGKSGRWRVWAVGKDGREGEKSPWRTFRSAK